MTNDEKKQLCEWMGYRVAYAYDFEPHRAKVYDENNKRLFRLFEWEPGDRHDEFAVVWEKLSEAQRGDTYIHAMPSDLTTIKPFYLVDAVLSDLPKVMKAVLEVLEIY